jgi:hypothetical protein
MCFYQQDSEAIALGQELFSLLDSDASGFLCLKELSRARELCKFDPSEADMELGNDINGDEKVDAYEWQQFVASLYGVIGKKRFIALCRQWMRNLPQSDCASPKSEPSLEEKNAAATKLQKVARGKQGRQKAKSKVAGKEQQGKTKESSMISLAELWENLCLEDGKLRTSVPWEELLDLFRTSKLAGLDMALAEIVPMTTAQSEIPPEDLCTEEVAHIMNLLMNDPDVAEETVRKELAIKSSQRREKANLKDPGRLFSKEKPAAPFNLRCFKRLCTLLSSLMAIDEEYIVISFAFQISGCLDVPEQLSALIRTSCGKDNQNVVLNGRDSNHSRQSVGSVQRGGTIEFASEDILQKPFILSDFAALTRDCQLISEKVENSLTYGEMNSIFMNTHRKLEELFASRKKKLRRQKAQKPVGNSKGFVGPHEFAVLLEALASTKPMLRRFPGPLSMCVEMIRLGFSNQMTSRKSC